MIDSDLSHNFFSGELPSLNPNSSFDTVWDSKPTCNKYMILRFVGIDCGVQA